MDDAAFTAVLHDHAGLLSRIAASYETDAALKTSSRASRITVAPPTRQGKAGGRVRLHSRRR